MKLREKILYTFVGLCLIASVGATILPNIHPQHHVALESYHA